MCENSHCVKSVQIRSFFWSVFSCIRTEYRKIRIRKNSLFGHFSRSVKQNKKCLQWYNFFVKYEFTNSPQGHNLHVLSCMKLLYKVKKIAKHFNLEQLTISPVINNANVKNVNQGSLFQWRLHNQLSIFYSTFSSMKPMDFVICWIHFYIIIL